MADEKHVIEFDLRGHAEVVAGLQQVAAVLGGFGTSGGGGGAGLGSIMLGVGKLNVALAVATAGFAGLSTAVNRVGQTLQELAQTRFGLGSSGSTSLLADLLGQAVGINNISGVAAGIHAGTLSGFGIGIAGQFGIPYRPYEIGGATDRGEMLLKVIEGLRQTRLNEGMGAAIGKARTLGSGAEQLLPLTFLSPEEIQNAAKLAQLNAEIYSPERIVAGTRLNLALAELKLSFTELETLIVTALIPGVKLLDYTFKASTMFAPGIMLARWWANRQAPLDQNTEALNRNSAEMQKLNGTYGGGTRTRGAMPSAFGVGAGFELGQALRSGHVRFGAYSVNF